MGDKLTEKFKDSVPLWKGPSSSHEFQFKPVTQAEVLGYLEKLENKSKADVVNIDSKLLYIARHAVVASLTEMFNHTLRNGVIPAEWKRARVTPIYKGKGSKDDNSNYRPVSVISFIAKILEKCVKRQLMEYLQCHEFITPDQSAYLRNHSTQTVLHKAVDGWLESMNDGLINGVCFIDFSKCFNTIHPDILLFKLQKYGIHNIAHKWFTSYLTNREQCTIVHEKTSKFEMVKIGIPQGSVLGTILFLLFMNDLPLFVKNVTQYADDTMLEVTASTVDEIKFFLQLELNKLSHWCAKNKLTINVSKSCSMLIGSNLRIFEYYDVESLGLQVQGEVLLNKNNFTYLGLEVDSKLSWNDNISKVCKKLGSRIALLQRLVSYLPESCNNTLYYAFIQPYIDYAITVWGNSSIGNINKVQKLQNRIARIMAHNFDYYVPGSEIIRDLGWQDVTTRKGYLSAILMYKCINDQAPNYMSDHLVYASEVHGFSTRNANRGNLYLPQPSTDYLKNAFIYNGPKVWNALPNHIRDATTLGTFKIRLKEFLK